MDFRDILMVASEQQGLSAVSKRYSLAVGPPKKDPKVKGVHSAAVQAFLRRKEEESRGKELEAKRKKEELLAKRIELKHDRKARAMASRTKDNFYGYNGIPIEEKPKKRQTCENVDRCTDAEYMTEDEAEQFEYSQTESEHEPEEYEEKPSKAAVKPKAPPKSATTPMNFVDLLRLAEKKQYEPVEIKVVKKTEERPRTAEELREREFLDRKNKKGEIQKEKKKPEKEIKNVTASSSSNKVFSHKEFINAKLSKNSVEKHSSSKGSFPSQCGTDKKSSGPVFSDKHARSSSSSKSSQVEKAKVTQNGYLKSSSSGIHSKSSVKGVGKFGSSAHTPSSKAPANGAQKLQSAKELSLKKSTSVHTKLGSATPPQHEIVKNCSSGRPGSSAGTSGPGRPGSSAGTSGPGRPGSSAGTGGPGRPGSSAGTGGPGRPGSSAGMGRPPSSAGTGGPGRPGSSAGTGRPGSSAGTGGPGRLPSSAGTGGPGRLPSSAGTGGPGRPGSSAGTGGPGWLPSSAGTGGPGRPGSSAGTGGPGRLSSSAGTGGPGRPGSSAGAGRPGSSVGTGGPGRPGSSAGMGGPGRPGSSARTGPVKSVSSSVGPGRSGSGSVAPPKPKCTVVSETISSKNLVSRPSNAPMNGTRPSPGHRPVFHPQGMLFSANNVLCYKCFMHYLFHISEVEVDQNCQRVVDRFF
ncbi:receptor-type tyrosine-protein phosphatase epsilon [Platysternon megacephalum]|uniref:Receptor-type tyrosine-protein phosphatase epsilon n=1 Tax=Platysternon megacephalum TaxID=55544 RepID=A0A4D9EIH8_9SAUR|nr:receptor-type tyrosine-protein phosphatase epsilon [Platysternon megacephalum]